MRRALLLLLLVSAGCAVTQDRLPPPPLPDDGRPVSYQQIIIQARQQANSANDAFYVSRWDELEQTAAGLEQSAVFLGKATEVPLRHKDQLAVHANELGKLASQLRAAAKDRDEKRVNENMQQITLKVRALYADR